MTRYFDSSPDECVDGVKRVAIENTVQSTATALSQGLVDHLLAQ